MQIKVHTLAKTTEDGTQLKVAFSVPMDHPPHSKTRVEVSFWSAKKLLCTRKLDIRTARLEYRTWRSRGFKTLPRTT